MVLIIIIIEERIALLHFIVFFYFDWYQKLLFLIVLNSWFRKKDFLNSQRFSSGDFWPFDEWVFISSLYDSFRFWNFGPNNFYLCPLYLFFRGRFWPRFDQTLDAIFVYIDNCFDLILRTVKNLILLALYGNQEGSIWRKLRHYSIIIYIL